MYGMGKRNTCGTGKRIHVWYGEEEHMWYGEEDTCMVWGRGTHVVRGRGYMYGMGKRSTCGTGKRSHVWYGEEEHMWYGEEDTCMIGEKNHNHGGMGMKNMCMDFFTLNHAVGHWNHYDPRDTTAQGPQVLYINSLAPHQSQNFLQKLLSVHQLSWPQL